jgi:hypothetical protein
VAFWRNTVRVNNHRKSNPAGGSCYRWFGDALLQQPVHITDLQRASVVDLLRLLDYPNDYVPVLTRHDPAPDENQPAAGRVDLVDKGALNARLARTYIVELLDRERIV